VENIPRIGLVQRKGFQRRLMKSLLKSTRISPSSTKSIAKLICDKSDKIG
jgi:hypothetical protein